MGGTVFLLCILFLMSVRAALLVIISVICSLINTIGFGYLWGLSLNLYTAAISAVALSGNYVWRLFFKCFMMITFFGLFHGLATLPVVLSLGPADNLETKKQEAKKEKESQINEGFVVEENV